MDGIDPSPTSKVIIQCIDPNNLYDSLEPRLSARSPLRNLHWKSPNRPLRSIPNLNISLSREDKSTGSQPTFRRHQIPGLRETPYVKLYLLRCDDRETYKEKARKELKQWVKSQTSQPEGKSSNKNQEDHDAFEWLIVHVVLANTAAASQPKSSKHISLETADSTDSVNSKSKWPGKSSSTIFDKLRADFSSSSKSPITRVAQVRIPGPNDKSATLSPAEIEEQWQDLIESLKLCILRSFDARVAQYEFDIRERDNQRALPGWNFCTFFVLKEGLAKGFESVGLLDDALAVYDELSLGLDGLVKEQAHNGDHDDSGALLNFSKESKNLIRTALDLASPGISPHKGERKLELARILIADRDDFPFDVDRKNYRNLILSNDVSALDLRIYLFTRELEILIRQGRGELSKSSAPDNNGADLNIIADLTERAVQFINLAARSLRLELYNAWGGQEGLSEEELHTQDVVTGNIVMTWEWRAAMQVLGLVSPALGLEVEYGAGSVSLDPVELSRDVERKSDQARNHVNLLSVALEPRASSRDRSQGPNRRISVIPDETNSRQIIFSRPGSERLALWISKLVIVARHALGNLEAIRPWKRQMKQAALNMAKHGTSDIVNGNTKTKTVPTSQKESDLATETHKEWMAGLTSSTVLAAASSKSAFLDLYGLLSVLAYRVAADAKNHRIAQQVLKDLVEMEYAQEEYLIAARFLNSILGPLPQSSYRPSDGYLLEIYADCLNHLDKPNERARCLIACLQWMSQGRPVGLSPRTSATNQHYVDQLFHVVHAINATTLPLTALFRPPTVSSTISHHDGKDGFILSMGIRPLSDTSTPLLDEVKMRLICQDGNEPRFIMLKISSKVGIDAAGTNVLLETPVAAHGWYIPDELEINIGKLRLLHHFRSIQDDGSTQPDERPDHRSSVNPILIYPRYRSLEVKVKPAPLIHLGESRRLLVQITPGYNDVKQCKLRLKTATAGLRLNIHDSKLLGEGRPSTSLRTAREGDALMIVVDDLEQESFTAIEIPYTMEIQSELAVTIRIDASYETDQGVFSLYDTASVNVMLPVTVNVQDVFRSSHMYSRFTISPSMLVPLHLINCRLEDNKSYSATVGGQFTEPLVVFPKQPASWTVRLVPKTEQAVQTAQRMNLLVDFQSIDDLVLQVLEHDFTSALLKTPYAFAARLLVSHLLNQVRTLWTEQDLEVTALSQEVEIWDMEEMNWASVLCALDKTTRSGIEDWLLSWHSNTTPIKVSSASAPQRQLKLHVDVAPPPVLISACLEIDTMQPVKHTATVGQPTMADLAMSLANSRETEVEASYEIMASSESWLIGGRRKGNVRLTKDATRIPIVLFPQQLGHALLPTISVKCRKRTQKNGGESWIDITSDVHNPMHGRSIVITPELRSTTVEVFGNITDDGHGRLVASEGRGGMG